MPATRATKPKVMLNDQDRAAIERITSRHPTIQNVTDAVRHAIHYTDRTESKGE